VTVPTATGPRGYGRGTVGLGLVHTRSLPLGRRLAWEGSVGVGATPHQGEMRRHQNALLLSASSGLGFNLTGRQLLHGNLFWHSPYHHSTGFAALDGSDLALDLGWSLRLERGRVLYLALTEDLHVAGPAIDLTLRTGLRF
jgi:hypothetical protein